MKCHIQFFHDMIELLSVDNMCDLARQCNPVINIIQNNLNLNQQKILTTNKVNYLDYCMYIIKNLLNVLITKHHFSINTRKM